MCSEQGDDPGVLLVQQDGGAARSASAWTMPVGVSVRSARLLPGAKLAPTAGMGYASVFGNGEP
jgi:hypothetical protein